MQVDPEMLIFVVTIARSDQGTTEWCQWSRRSECMTYVLHRLLVFPCWKSNNFNLTPVPPHTHLWGCFVAGFKVSCFYFFFFNPSAWLIVVYLRDKALQVHQLWWTRQVESSLRSLLPERWGEAAVIVASLMFSHLELHHYRSGRPCINAECLVERVDMSKRLSVAIGTPHIYRWAALSVQDLKSACLTALLCE